MSQVGTLQWKKKVSAALRGKYNPMFGKKHKRSTLSKISQKLRGKKNPMFGRKHSLETLKKMSAAIRRAFRNRGRSRR